MNYKEGKMSIFEGKQRTGKTLSSCIWTYSDYKKGRPIYSNIELAFPHKPLNFDDLTMRDESGELEGSTILLDEMNFYVENRGAMSKINKEFTMFLLQIKKSDINVYATSHELQFVDIRIRSHFDYLIRPKCYPEKRKENEPPSILQLDITNGPTQRKMHKIIKFDPRPYLGLYNTKNRVNPFEQRESVIENNKREFKKYKKRVIDKPRIETKNMEI